MFVLVNLTKLQDENLSAIIFTWFLQIALFTCIGGFAGSFVEIDTNAYPALDFSYANVLVGISHGMAAGFVYAGLQFAVSSYLTAIKEQQTSWGAIAALGLFMMVDLALTVSEASLTMVEPSIWFDAENSMEDGGVFIVKMLMSLFAGYLLAFFSLRFMKASRDEQMETDSR